MNNFGSFQPTFTRVLRGDNSTVLLSVNSGSGLENLLVPEPLGMLGLFDLLPLSLVTDPTVAEFMMGGGPPPRPPTSRNLLNNLPVQPVETKEGCPICQSDMEIGESAMVLPCNHRFHVDCVKPWLTDNNTCPTCRYELDTDDPAYNEQLRQRRAGGNTAAAASSTSASSTAPAASAPVASAAAAPSTTQAQVGRTEARPSPQPSLTPPTSAVTVIPLVAPQPTSMQMRQEQPRVRVVRVEQPGPRPRPRPLVTVNLDPAVIAYSARTGIPLTQLVPLLLQRGGGQIRVQVDEGDNMMLAPQSAQSAQTGQLVRVPDSDLRRSSSTSTELDSVFDAALSEFEQLERNNAHRPPERNNAHRPAPAASAALRNQTGATETLNRQLPRPTATREVTQRQTQQNTSSPVPDMNAMVTAAHLQALNTHSQLIQRHSDASRQGDSEEHHRLHSQTMAAHADLMAAHRQFMAHFCGQNRTERRESQPVEQPRPTPTTLQDTMERNLRQYFGGQKKRKNTTRSEPESKARNTQLGNTQSSEC